MEPKYPNVRVKLSGQDGNAFAILGKVVRALRDHGVPKAEILAFQQKATCGTYDDMLQTVLEYVEVE